MGFWSIAAPIAGAVIGAKGQRDAAKAAAGAGQLDLGKLRADALAHGFNPLTVLGATGGRGFETTADAPGFLSFLAQQGPQVGASIGQAIQDRPQRDADLANTQAQTGYYDAMAAQAEADALRSSVAGGDRIEDQLAANPLGYSAMRRLDGGLVDVRNDIILALRKRPGDTLIAEDFEALSGDIGQEFSAALDAASIAFGGTAVIRDHTTQRPAAPVLGQQGGGSSGRRDTNANRGASDGPEWTFRLNPLEWFGGD